MMKTIIPGLLMVAVLTPSPCASDSGNNAFTIFRQWHRLQAQEERRDAKFDRIEKAAEKSIKRMRKKNTSTGKVRGKDAEGR
ncbi:MAG: hypothetical protein FJ118_17300 [Deltaproteobacteria bacterium]|nr:hypothetical protein [Deltaproteobacteria bacterium]